MKTAEQWDKEGKCYASVARQIQIDALEHASRIAQKKKIEFLNMNGDKNSVSHFKMQGAMEVEGAIVAAMMRLDATEQLPQ